jgi:MFS family permease
MSDEASSATRTADKLREPIAALARVFRNPGLRRVNLAFAGSVIGDWAAAIVVSIYAYERGGAAVLGILGVVRYLTMAVAAPLLSTLADRYRRERVMIGADLARTLLITVVAVNVARGGPALIVYVFATATIVIGTAFRPAQAALLPSLANDPGELTAANVAASTIESVGFFLGPALAAVLLTFTNQATVFAVDAASFLVSALLISGLRVAARDGAAQHHSGGFISEATAGFRTISADRDLRLLMALFFAQTVVAGASLVYEVAVALQLIDVGQSGLALLSAVMGAAGIVGGFVALVLAARQKIAADFGFGVLLWSAPLLLLAIWPTVASAIVLMALTGVGNSLVDINIFTILQRIVPDEVMGRVFGAVESTIVLAMACGSLLMPLLIATVGLRWGLALIGGAAAAVALMGFAGLRRIDATTLAPPKLYLVAGTAILAPLPERRQEALARALIEITVAPGEVVFHEGDTGDRFFIIERGSVEVVTAGEIVNILGPSDSFGEIALLHDVPRMATIRAIDDVTLQALDRDTFIPAVTGHGEAATQAENIIALLLAR